MRKRFALLACGASLAASIASPASAASLLFHGNGVNDIDRVKIQIADTDTNPNTTLHRPADVGATDFTLEFWLRSAPGNNAPAVTCDANNEWIFGNIVVDRDRFFQGQEYGISVAGGRIVFGVMNRDEVARTICGTSSVLDGQWHHVAVQRDISNGLMELFVDGVREASVTGPPGDIAYPDDGVPESVPDCGGPCTNSDPYLVIGAEKHDAGPQFPAWHGWVDELRISTTRRYSASGFPVPSQAFDSDPATAALYHFDEPSGLAILDFSGAAGGPSDGVMRIGGNPAGPERRQETPFAVTPSPGTIRFQTSSVSIGEAGPTIALNVRRDGGTQGPATVSYRTDPVSATPGADYVATMGTLTWPDGDSAPKAISVTIVEDAAPDPNEQFRVVLENATGAMLGSQATATVTITDNDAAQPSPGSLQFSASTANVSEGNASVSVSITRTGGADGAASIVVQTASGTASSGNDFTGVTQTVSWAGGESAPRAVSIPILEDSVDEGDETFSLTLSGATGGTSVGLPSSITVTIADNDGSAPTPESRGGGPYTRLDLLACLLGLMAAAQRRRRLSGV